MDLLKTTGFLVAGSFVPLVQKHLSIVVLKKTLHSYEDILYYFLLISEVLYLNACTLNQWFLTWAISSPRRQFCFSSGGNGTKWGNAGAKEQKGMMELMRSCHH